MKNITILGGGTAGWLTALYAQKMFPTDNITLIESKEIGILGAGEGSTPKLVQFFDFLEIPLEDFIKKTKSTLKVGIKFTNWAKENGYYYHNFELPDSILSQNIFNPIKTYYSIPDIETETIIKLVSDIEYKNINNDIYDNNKIPFIFKDTLSYDNNKMNDFNLYSGYSLHFDAKLLANFLSEVGVSRGINLIEGKVLNVNSQNNKIYSLDLEDNKNILTDFIFDCTGFARLLIGKHYNSKWKTFSDQLPMKKALPFFLETEKEQIPPYTEAIAMKYGWIWKIPLQHRYGCGYVFDSDYVSEEEVKKEIEDYFKIVPEYPRKDKGAFSFDPGCFEEIWIENCIAVGLSSGFLEPLEATSIGQLLSTLQALFVQKHKIFSDDKKIKDILNKKFVKETEYIVDFLSLHYTTNKNNSEFWVDFNKKNKKSKKLLEEIHLLENSILTFKDTNYWFGHLNYYSVAFGNKIIDYKNIKEIYESHNLKIYEDVLKYSTKIKNNVFNNFINHSNFLKYMGGLND